MLSPDRGRERSSMESFLDEYQLVRIGLTLVSLIPVAVFLLLGRSAEDLVPIAVVLVAIAVHAVWCRSRGIRSPKTMLALDLTAWGWVMTLLADTIAVPTASLGFLVLVVVLFAQGPWIALFVTYICGWYGIAFFAATAPTVESVGVFVGVLVTVGSVGLVVWHVRRWLGRLDANRSQMLGTVSHELRNNLTGMIGLTDLVSEETGISDDETKELIGLAHDQAMEAAEIVEDLLTVSRLERSALTVDMTAVDLQHEIETVARRFAGEGTVVSIESGGVGHVHANALRVRQILRNLISNAVRYGGPNIEVRTDTEGDRVTVTVTDDGDGVPSEDVVSIFLPYRRSAATRRHESSVGLGLWIARQLAVAMGGTLDYRREGSLTSFTVTLEAVEQLQPGNVAAASRVTNPTAVRVPGTRDLLPAVAR